jgi:hypothetical protein
MVRARRNALQKERRWLKREGGKDGKIARKTLMHLKQSCANEIDPQVCHLTYIALLRSARLNCTFLIYLQTLVKNFKELVPSQWLLTTVKIGKELGRGVFGAVYAATCDQLECPQLAVKQQIIKLSGGVSNLRKALVSFVSEFKMYMHLGREPAVVQTFGGNIEICDSIVTCSIFMERAPMTLHSFLKKDEAVPLSKKLQIVTELLGLLRFLERQELCHSDIKVSTS